MCLSLNEKKYNYNFNMIFILIFSPEEIFFVI